MGTGLKFLFEEEVIMNQGTILGSQIGKWIILVALVAALGVLLLTIRPVGAQGSSTILYPENGTDPVATFTATDPEGRMIHWDVLATNPTGIDDVVAADAADADLFMVKDGVLSFMDSPNYENARDSGGDNIYKVVVVASDSMADTARSSYHKVTVAVTDVADEKGKVTWTIAPGGTTLADPKLLQFEVGAVLMASVTDADADTITPTWEWYRSSTKTSMGTAIDGQTEVEYTVVAADADKYLRVTATYDVNGDDRSASLVSDYKVLASSGDDNTAPVFSQTSIAKNLDEGDKGMSVGTPVTATDDGPGKLNYTLAAGTDNTKFEIDQKTGQIKTMVKLNHEANADDEDNCNVKNRCVVTVTATDSAGQGSATPATVTIALQNVDEKPYFDNDANTEVIQEPMSMIQVMEGMTGPDTEGEATYTAVDPDGDNVTLSLTGTDASKFELTGETAGTRDLAFETAPDYEKPMDRNKDNVYEVTVRATAGSMRVDLPVTVMVTPVDEPPMIVGASSVPNYSENRTDPVATFTATDPEGRMIHWDVLATNPTGIDDVVDADAADADLFMVKDGVLSFMDSPNYENPRDAGEDNIYKVVVVASDSMADTARSSYHKVTVAVTDVADEQGVEKGKVTWTIAPGVTALADPKLLQFEVGATLTASVTDADIDGGNPTPSTWKWYRSSTKTAMGTAIDGQTEDDYTVVAADANKYLRVTATYNVDGDDRSASLVSDYKVLASRDDNTAPVFSQTSIAWDLDEGDKGMTVGTPVTATDDGPGKLNYTLAAGTDNTKFEIDQKTGQIKTMVKLNHEANADDEDNCNVKNRCVVTVTATDSAGQGSATPATVTIALQNVDEKPYFDNDANTEVIQEPMSMIQVMEGMTGPDTEGEATYTAVDPDGDNVTLSLTGTDASKFELTGETAGTRDLAFETAPDYEKPMDRNKDNVYEVTVRATAGSMRVDLPVTVMVTPVDEPPMIMEGGLVISGAPSMNISEDETDADAMFTATGPMQDMARWTLEGADARYFSVDRARGAMTELMFRSPPDYEMPRGMAISDTNTNTYVVTLKANDGTYMDTHDVTVMVTNMEEDGTVTLSPMSPVVGEVVTATLSDDDGGVTGTTWQWAKHEAPADGSMPADDSAGWMDIDEATMMTYTPMAADGDYYLRATATYTDGYDSGNEEMATTTSAVVANNAPEFAEAMTTREVPENSEAGAAVGNPVTATDADSGDTLAYTLSGDDMYFTIDTSTGQIMVGMDTMLDHEAEKSTYMVTVTATDGSDAPNDSASIPVTIDVTNVEELGTLAGMGSVDDYEENGTDAVETYTLDGTMMDTAMWSLAGDDMDQFMLDPTSGGSVMLKFENSPDYEAAADSDGDNTYEVAVMAEAGGEMKETAVTVTVTNVNEAPMFAEATADRSINENSAEGMAVGDPVTATDPDAGDTLAYSLNGDDATYFSIDDMGQITVGMGAMLDHEAEKSTYMVTVTATDSEDLTDTIEVTINVTDVDEGPVQRYDTDGTPGISIAELFVAIDDYFAEGISISELFDVIDAYFG